MKDQIPDVKEVVIMCPGFLDPWCAEKFSYVQKQLSREGIGSFAIDPCGLWAGGRDIKKYTIAGYVLHIMERIEFVKQTYPDLKRIILLGHSLGAYLALKVAETCEDVYMVVAVAPPHEQDLVDLANKWPTNGQKESTRTDPRNDMNRVFYVPYAFAKELAELAAIQVNPGVRKYPVIFVDPGDDEALSTDGVYLLGRRFGMGDHNRRVRLADQDHHLQVRYPEGWRVVVGEMVEFLA